MGNWLLRSTKYEMNLSEFKQTKYRMKTTIQPRFVLLLVYSHAIAHQSTINF